MSTDRFRILETYKPVHEHLDKLDEIVALIASTIRQHNRTSGVDVPLSSIGIPCTLHLYESFGPCYIREADGNIKSVNVPSLVVQRIGTDEGYENRGLLSLVVAALEKIVREHIPLLDVNSPAVKRIASACKIPLSEFMGEGGYCRQLHIQCIITKQVQDIFVAKGFCSFLQYGSRDQLYKVFPDEKETLISSLFKKIALDCH
jgi:hypothetical protein